MTADDDVQQQLPPVTGGDWAKAAVDSCARCHARSHVLPLMLHETLDDPADAVFDVPLCSSCHPRWPFRETGPLVGDNRTYTGVELERLTAFLGLQSDRAKGSR